MLFIDEAQRISDIGINLKIIHDNRPDLKILVTGSSSFDLANKLNEPLTGSILSQMYAVHSYSDSVRNFKDTAYIIYFKPDNIIRFSALVVLKDTEVFKTVIRLDSILNYSCSNFYDSITIHQLLNKYDSIGIDNVFEKEVIQRLTHDSISDRKILFDNYLILNRIKK